MSDESTKKTVPLRQMEVWQADDGRRIEVFIKTKEIPYINQQNQDSDENNDEMEFNAPDKIFVGVAQIQTPYGTKDIKFEIPSSDVETAFTDYYEYANQAVQELYEKIQNEKQQQSQDQSIVTASPDALRVLDENQGNDNGENIIMP